MILIYITCKDEQEAVKITKHLLRKKLIACNNFFPIKSMYWWKGKIEKDNEIVLLAKTTEDKYDSVVKEVKKIHSYDIPCIMKLKADCNKEYDNWIKEETFKNR